MVAARALPVPEMAAMGVPAGDTGGVVACPGRDGMVMAAVVPVRQELEVLEPIIQAIAVAVVDVFAGQQGAAHGGSHDGAMFAHPAAGGFHEAIAPMIQARGALGAGAERPSGEETTQAAGQRRRRIAVLVVAGRALARVVEGLSITPGLPRNGCRTDAAWLGH